MPTIFDNREGKPLGHELRDRLASAVGLDACVGYLNLRGWGLMADRVDELTLDPGRPPARLLVGMAVPPGDEIRRLLRIQRDDEPATITQKDVPPLRDQVLRDFRDQLALGAPTERDEVALRHFRGQLADRRVVVKFFARYPLHAKLYLLHLADGQVLPELGYVGSSNLTMAGLARNGELNVDVTDQDATSKLCRWFEDRWEDRFAIDVTDRLVEIIDESWAAPEQPDPYHVYLRLAYELSQDARDGLRDYDIPANLRGVLLDHQEDAVRVASKMLESRGGVMVGDVVGLGKTLTAVAIARILQDQRDYETLVICPKNLVKMWKEHLKTYRVPGEVVSLSMVHRELPDTTRHRLVVVDESHNLRNTETRQWQAVRAYIERNDPKVLLLTATPYNKQYLDVAGQLRLFLDPDDDLGIRPEALIANVGELDAARLADSRLTSLRAFEYSEFAEDWQRLMSLFLVRRTRSFVEKKWATEDEEGRLYLTFPDGTPYYFPDRVPSPLEYRGGADDAGDRLASVDTVDRLAELSLPRYRVGAFIRPNAVGDTPAEVEVLARLRRAGGNLQGFVRTMLMKRLSSSGPAFLLSVERHLLRNHVFIHAIDHGLDVPLGAIEDRGWAAEGDDPETLLDRGDVTGHAATGRREWSAEARAHYEALQDKPPSGVTWLPSRLLEAAILDELRRDSKVLESILDEHAPWDPARDSKVEALAALVSERHAGQKVLVFSEYADTAEYVGTELASRLPSAAVESVTGATSDPTRVARRFSPGSNRALGGLPPGATELQVVVATDVLSEGQNLQDAWIIVNYDLPWTIIKMIQRAGRVDRVGQNSPEVIVYSMLPQTGVEDVIRLRERISQRLSENAAAFGSDERFFDLPDEVSNEQVRGMFDGTANLNLEESDEDVDWASTALAIWEAADAADAEIAAGLPGATYSTRGSRRRDEEGTLVYTRTTSGLDGLAYTAAGSDPAIITPFEALKIAEAAPGEQARSRNDFHHDDVRKAVTEVLLASASRPLAITHSGPRARLYRLLVTYREDVVGTLYDTLELRRLIDDVFHRPLLESAKHRMARLMREKPQSQVAEVAIELHDDAALLVELDDREDDIGIILSMGVRAL